MLGALLNRESRVEGIAARPARPRFRDEQLGSSHPCPVDPHRPQAIGHRPTGPSAQGPQARRRPGKAFPSRCTETTPRELVKTPIGIDDPLSSPYGMSPKQSDGGPGAAGRH